jgi:hypothetical protein
MLLEGGENAEVVAAHLRTGERVGEQRLRPGIGPPE